METRKNSEIYNLAVKAIQTIQTYSNVEININSSMSDDEIICKFREASRPPNLTAPNEINEYVRKLINSVINSDSLFMTTLTINDFIISAKAHQNRSGPTKQSFFNVETNHSMLVQILCLPEIFQNFLYFIDLNELSTLIFSSKDIYTTFIDENKCLAQKAIYLNSSFTLFCVKPTTQRIPITTCRRETIRDIKTKISALEKYPTSNIKIFKTHGMDDKTELKDNQRLLEFDRKDEALTLAVKIRLRGD